MADTSTNTSTNNNLTLIVNAAAALLPVLLQYGIPLVEQAFRAIKQDPTLPADALKAAIAKRLDDASKNSSDILNQ